MKKWILAAVVFTLLACSCGSDPIGQTPTQVATTFNEYIFSRQTGKAYPMFSSRIKILISYEDFEKFSSSSLTDEAKEIMKKTKVKYTGETIEGVTAVVYCSVNIENNEGPFRVRLVKESGNWMIDSEILEDQFAKDSSFYRNFDLTQTLTKYCEYLADGKSQGLWVMTSKRIKASIDFESFKKAALMTGTGKTPKQEGFNISALSAYADDSGNGLGIISMINRKIGNDELAKGMAFKMPFIYEDEQWKANFVNITKKDIYDPSKEGSK